MNHSVGSSPENQGNSRLANLEENNGHPPFKISHVSSLLRRDHLIGELNIGLEPLLAEVV